jgi:molybdate transport system substrate-binding protein
MHCPPSRFSGDDGAYKFCFGDRQDSTWGSMMRRVFAGVMLFLGSLSAAGAAEIKVLSSGNMATILAAVTGEFERTTGHKLIIEYGSTTRMKSRVEADEPADLTINEKFVLEDLLRQARVETGTMVDIARSPLGIGVRAGAPKPDVSSVDGLKRTLLAAESIAYPDPSGGAQDGTYFVHLIRRLGIADQLKPKIELTKGGDAAGQAVASGSAQIGVAQRRNFISLNGVQLLEPLPDLPGIKFLMVAGVVAGAREPDGAMAFAKFLSSPSVAPVIRANGMEPYM